MKLHAGINTVEKSGNFEESKFSIEASSKAFFILSDGLYSNKILAVIRELSTNAYDSHVAAGKKNVPFDVHLPTAIDNVFSIRDYGTSMSHEDCMQLYTTYFRSTRNNSNDAVGCLGLGSKAPFAYTDSFTVEAYKDGVARFYTAYKNEDGSPVFSLLEERTTSEPDGIKVSIVVSSGDTHRFYHEARKVYEFFNVRPNFVGEKIAYENPDKILSGDSWYYESKSDNLLIMGQIAYPLDARQISNDLSSKEARFLEYSDGLRIFVNIGDVDITPSRESLSYSKETKNNICATIQSIANEIAVKIESEIKDQPTLFKARNKYIQICDQCSSIENAIESLKKSIMWNDIKLFDNIATESINVTSGSVTSLYKNSWRKKIESTSNVENIFFKNGVKFIVDDIKRGGMTRIKQQMKDNYGQCSYYVYKLRDGETVDSCEFYNILGGATKEDVVLTSSLPKMNYSRTSSRDSDGSTAVQCQVFYEESGRFESCHMSVNFENAFYLIESKGMVEFNGRDHNIEVFSRAIEYLYANCPEEMDGKTFYAIKPSVFKNRKIDERDNWSNGAAFIVNMFNTIVDKNKQDIIDCMYVCDLSKKGYQHLGKVIKLTETSSTIKDILSQYEEYMSGIKRKEDSVRNIEYIANGIGCNKIQIDNSMHKNITRFSDVFDKTIDSCYPMLKYVNRWYDNKDEKIIVQYIDSVNKNN